LTQTLRDEGCEWVGHGLAANELMHAKMTIEAQRQHIQEALQAHVRALGVRPAGWLSQDWGTTAQTFDVLAEAGLEYTLDWCNDDQPYYLNAATAAGRRLVAVPLSPEWDDVQCQWLRNLRPRQHAELSLQAFDQLRQECAHSGRGAVFVLTLHPWVCGMPSRIGALRQLLGTLAERPGVQWSSPGEIARLHRSNFTPH
jgi:peptidoglycan/xylan/chitin deacetylase (PgdA/CDA1 family)